MPKTELATRLPETLARKLVHLAQIAPDDLRGLELLIDDAIARHQEDDRIKRLALFHRVK